MEELPSGANLIAVGLLAEKLVGGRSRYALYMSESYRTLSTTVPLCATNPGVQVSCDAGVSMQRSCEWKKRYVGRVGLWERSPCANDWLAASFGVDA